MNVLRHLLDDDIKLKFAQLNQLEEKKRQAENKVNSLKATFDGLQGQLRVKQKHERDMNERLR